MANCHLSIELAEADQPIRGGEPVRGTVVVKTDANLNCKGLEVATRWETHGRGNVASGDVERTTVFQGEWLAGQTYRYDFELRSGTWPPTYHGDYLSVDHVVRATAKLPWKIDPTTAHPFRVYVTEAPASGAPPVVASSPGLLGKLGKGLLILLVGVFALIFLLNPFFWCLGALFALGSGVWWFIRKWMPARKLGNVEFRVENPRLSPGEALRAELVLSPKRDVTLNGISLALAAKEVCCSGSGSNRSTHTQVVYESETPVMASGTLAGDQVHRFPITVPLPMRPIYSIDLNDNDITWTADLRIDIPSWPDWVSQEALSVVPPSQPSAAAALLLGANAAEGAPTELQSFLAGADGSSGATEASAGMLEPPAVGFDETARLIWQNREQPETVDQLVEAVQGLAMDVSLRIERRSYYGDASDAPFTDPRDTIFLASHGDPPLPVKLYLPGGSTAEIADIERQARWSGPAEVVGFDHANDRLLIKARR